MRVEGGVEDGDDTETQPQSEAAVRRSVLSVSSGDRIMEAIELADSEMKAIAGRSKKPKVPNLLLLGMDPPNYIFWVLRTIKSAELEQSFGFTTSSHGEVNVLFDNIVEERYRS